MRRSYSIAFVLLMLSMSACSSQPAKDRYYSLTLEAGDATTSAQSGAAKTQLIVGPIQLARYLDQAGLAMQLGANQIRIANHHFWAEPLDEAIGKLLVRDISSQVSNIAVDRDAGRWTDDGNCHLRVEFDRFHATQDSRVVAAGRYWIRDNESASSIKREFDLVRALSDDGYAHAVGQLRATIGSLADEIVENVVESGGCAADTGKLDQ